jgi:enoyl-CoA hydratase/carnithine racemase
MKARGLVMDGFQARSSIEGGFVSGSLYAVADQVRSARVEGLTVRRLEALDTLVVTKSVAGFDDARIAALRDIVRDARLGRLGRLKFIVFDFAHEGESETPAGAGFDGLVAEVANLILEAPIVSVAYARATLGAVDLEFALGCSMLIGEADARFSFAADPIVAIGVYGFLAQKIGFVRAERLMEGAEVLDAQQMHDALLLKEVTPAGAGADGIEAYVTRALRRHNASYGIYRAQRIASPAVRTSLAVA